MDDENIKIILIIFFSFWIPLELVYLMDETIDLNVQASTSNEIIQSSNLDKTKVFLIGSSRIMQLDAKFMDEYIFEKGKKVDVYNHGLNGERPSARLPVLEKSISEQPDLVFIGVDITHYFMSPKSSSSSSNLGSEFGGCNKKLPEIQDLYSIIFTKDEVVGIDFENFHNPKFTTLNFISKLPKFVIQENKPGDWEILIPIAPRTNQTLEIMDELPVHMKNSLASLTNKQTQSFYNKNFRIINDAETLDKEIQEKRSTKWFSSSIEPNGKEVVALRKIIERLQKNNIEVVLFSTPIYKSLYDSAYPCGINDFEQLLENLSIDYKISHYLIHDKYLDENIWRDSNHIVHGKHGLSYSKDVANAIFKEI